MGPLFGFVFEATAFVVELADLTVCREASRAAAQCLQEED